MPLNYDRSRRSLAALLAALTGSIIAAHAALLSLGTWYPDEFHQFGLLRASGLAQLTPRVFAWSPRPVSEMLLLTYAGLVQTSGSPGVAWALGATWTAVLVLMAGAARLARVGLVVAPLIFAIALLIARPGEMFYWPAAALAYLPAFAGIAAASLLVVGLAVGRRRDAGLAAALLIAAGSAEAGAFFVLIFCSLQCLRHAAGLRWPAVRSATPFAVWLIPLLLAAGVLGVLSASRLGATAEVLDMQGTAGRLGVSLEVTLRTLPAALVGVPLVPSQTARFWPGLSFKIVVLLGLWALMPRAPASLASRLDCLAALAALGGMLLVTVVFAYRQFGVLCCDRHETFRQALLVVAALLAAGALPRMRGRASRLGATACLVAVLTFFGAQRLPAWRADLGLRAEAIAVQNANWASGRAPGDAMTFRTQPIGRITAGWHLKAGEYRRPDLDPVQPADLPLHAFAIMLFFEKRIMTVAPNVSMR